MPLEALFRAQWVNSLLRLVWGPRVRVAARTPALLIAWWPSAVLMCVQVRGRLTVQEGRNVQYTGIMHAARTILKEVRPTGIAAREAAREAASCATQQR
jgi:hypothetical protein